MLTQCIHEAIGQRFFRGDVQMHDVTKDAKEVSDPVLEPDR